MTLVRWSTTHCIGVCCNAMCCGVAWHGRRARLCALPCGRRGVGSAGVWLGVGVQPEHRQLEHRLSDDHGGRTRPCAVARMRRAIEVLVAAVVRAQMWGWPTSDVGESRRLCGRRPVADVGQAWLNWERVLFLILMNGLFQRRLCDGAPLIASVYAPMRCMALRRGVARPARSALCAAVWTAWGRLGRRLPRRRRSTRTSAAGTPRE